MEINYLKDLFMELKEEEVTDIDGGGKFVAPPRVDPGPNFPGGFGGSSAPGC